MRKIGLALTCAAVLMFAAGAAVAQTETTLLDQSLAGTAVDTTPLPAALKTAIIDSTKTETDDFVVEAGAETVWKGIWGDPVGEDDEGFIDIEGTYGDTERIDIWCDIEMYLELYIENNQIYFHRATTGAGEQVAYVQGHFVSNNGWFVGLETSPTIECDITKLIGTTDVIGRDISPDAVDEGKRAPLIDVAYGLADDGDATYDHTQPPGSGTTYAAGDEHAGGTTGEITAIWWLINAGAAGTQHYEWRVSINPPAAQPDGHYELDPVVAAKPAL